MGERAARTPESVARAVDALERLIDGRRVAVLTGAGLSTDSGIPDYRGDGSKPRRTPMTAQRFVSDEADRKRYWAGSALGWKRMRDVQPNAGHVALARLEAAGVVAGVATQNVDSLHQRAGTKRLIELHGHLRTVSCLRCGTPETRESLDARLRQLNPWLPADLDEVPLNPDGDAEVARVDEMVVPACLVCGGMLKPDVVFFGEFVRPENREAAEALVDDADVLLSVGSSLVVNTGRRLIHRARRADKPVAIINRGPTAADHEAELRVEGGTSEVLAALAARLRVPAPARPDLARPGQAPAPARQDPAPARQDPAPARQDPAPA
ncbi:NAD-dependent deacetylase [Pseudoclavibacter endophyticus]|uniref:protein acetyllysine N-acetyltransferase n=1 Tax=Pseudoclavibacter endophyticus TaxID=1778590 RepID=A0A6H9WI12_9MICO|nr:NAD-dependent deacetylase [Pseudoclavibacter endophyticus]